MDYSILGFSLAWNVRANSLTTVLVLTGDRTFLHAFPGSPAVSIDRLTFSGGYTDGNWNGTGTLDYTRRVMGFDFLGPQTFSFEISPSQSLSDVAIDLMKDWLGFGRTP
jgi:hypothetical protein